MSHKAVNSATRKRGCLDGVVVNTSALESRGRGFKSRSGQFSEFHLWFIMSLFHWFQFNLSIYSIKKVFTPSSAFCELEDCLSGVP